MLSRVTSGRFDVLQRRCLGCGYGGEQVERDAACPRCGCDFTIRPPRSYAEMEGFVGDPMPIEPVDSTASRDRLLGRWALFVAFSLGLLLSLLYLTAEVLRAV
jgi:hypothetical protein